MLDWHTPLAYAPGARGASSEALQQSCMVMSVSRGVMPRGAEYVESLHDGRKGMGASTPGMSGREEPPGIPGCRRGYARDHSVAR